MKQGLTELVFILDKSGSMHGLENDTIGGYNSFIETQKQQPGSANLTTVLFSSGYELLHDRINLADVAQLNENDYQVGGNTALIDAIGRTIDQIGQSLSDTAEDDRPEKVLFVIITAGMENASRRYTADDVRQKIPPQKDTYNWEFIFLGANIDAVETASRFGIGANRTASYHSDSRGTRRNFDSLSPSITRFRSSEPNTALDDDWSSEIDQDYAARQRAARKTS